MVLETEKDYSSFSNNDLIMELTQVNSQVRTLEQTIASQNELLAILQKHSVRSRMLAEMTRKIDVRLLDTIEHAATVGVAELFGVERAALLLVDHDHGFLAFKKSYPEEFKTPPLDMVNDSDVLLIHAIKQGSEPVIFHSIETYEIDCGCEFRPHPTDAFFRDGGMVCPLHYNSPDSGHNEMVGLLILSGGKFSQEDLSEATLVAEVFATTLSNHFLLAKMSLLAETDGLTRLFNHRHFQQELTRCIASYGRYKTAFSLIVLDIDDFKHVNDTYLHQTGDFILKEVSRVIRQSLRDNIDIASRYGGEEFALLLPHTRLEGAKVVAERLRATVERERFRIGGETIVISVSAGVAEYREGLEKSTFVDMADSALYAAKRNGKNQVLAMRETDGGTEMINIEGKVIVAD